MKELQAKIKVILNEHRLLLGAITIGVSLLLTFIVVTLMHPEKYDTEVEPECSWVVTWKSYGPENDRWALREAKVYNKTALFLTEKAALGYKQRLLDANNLIGNKYKLNITIKQQHNEEYKQPESLSAHSETN